LDVQKKYLPLHSHLKNGLRRVLKDTDAKKSFKNLEKKFGDLKIMRTFAAPFRKRVLERENQQVH